MAVRADEPLVKIPEPLGAGEHERGPAAQVLRILRGKQKRGEFARVVRVKVADEYMSDLRYCLPASSRRRIVPAPISKSITAPPHSMRTEHELRSSEGTAVPEPRMVILIGICYYPGIIFTMETARVRGPSNSQKNKDCQVPRTSSPRSTRTISEAPTSELLTCAAELPSVCL